MKTSESLSERTGVDVFPTVRMNLALYEASKEKTMVAGSPAGSRRASDDTIRDELHPLRCSMARRDHR